MQANVANDLDACSLVAEEDKTLAGAYAVQQLSDSLDCGVAEEISLNANSGTDFTVNFSSAFKNPPVVSMTAIANHNQGVPILRVKEVTTNGFTGRLFNNDGTSLTCKIGWIAVCK